MKSSKLKEFINTATFNIIDDWTCMWIERLGAKEAIEKYGDCDVWSSYTSGGYFPEFTTDVWVEIPGMHLSNAANHKITIPSVRDDFAEFVGRKTGMLITVTKYGDDDYDAWWRYESERDNETAGYSVRGTMAQIVDELEGEV